MAARTVVVDEDTNDHLLWIEAYAPLPLGTRVEVTEADGRMHVVIVTGHRLLTGTALATMSLLTVRAEPA